MKKRAQKDEELTDFRRVREQLRYWPYTIHQIEDTLDIGLIEGRGRQLLFQAVNARNLTAFVGSGLSASYGRLTWWDWQQEQLTVVREGADAFKALTEVAIDMIKAHIPLVDPNKRDSPDPGYAEAVHAAFNHDRLGQTGCYNIWRWLRYRKKQVEGAWSQVERLKTTFECSESDGDFPGGEPLPMRFQIAQQLHDGLRQHIQIFLAPHGVNEDLSRTLEKCWPGARIDKESAAPMDALAQLHKIIEHHRVPQIDAHKARFVKALSDYIRVFTREQAAVSAEMLAKMLLVDERAHAMITLRSGLIGAHRTHEPKEVARARYDELERELGIYSDRNLKRKLDGIRDDQDLYRVLSAFRFDAFQALEDRVRDQGGNRLVLWDDLLSTVRGKIDRYMDRIKLAGDDRRFLTPSSRFLVAVYLNLLDNPWEVEEPKGDDDDPGQQKDRIAQLLPLLKTLKPDDFRSRRSIIADRFDPLSKTVRGLGIKRYITMNYDMEIERFFQDLGYRKFPPREAGAEAKAGGPEHGAHQFRSDPTGGVLLDQTFSRSEASELTAFAIDESREEAAVFHLHGRATREDSLVVTERDYMNLYLLEDEHRDTVNEGITMAFSSAPLLFLGLGMNEADLLRPLRQFMSNRDRTIGYHAVAILPAEKPIEARTKFSVTCFLRYGVHTIFYGSGTVKVEGKDRGLDWLCRVIQLTKAIEKEVDALAQGTQASPPEALLARIAAEMGHVSSDIAEPYSKGALALAALFGRDIGTGDEAPKAETVEPLLADLCREILSGERRIKHCRFTPIRPNIKSEQTRHFDKKGFIKSKPYTRFATAILNEALRILLRFHQHGSDATDHAALKAVTKGLGGAFLTGALNAQLVALEREWRHWWKNWQESPPHRYARFQKLNEIAIDGLDFHPVRFIRHSVDSIITRRVPEKGPLPAGDVVERSASGKGLRLRPEFQTRIRAYDNFMVAIEDFFSGRPESGATVVDGKPVDRPKDPQKRLLLTVAAYRGLGKGSFLTAMSSSLGLTVYERVTWSNAAQGQPRPFLMGACFINFSFSTEIASCYDSLRYAVVEMNVALKCALEDLAEGRSTDDVRAMLQASLNKAAEDRPRPYHFRYGEKRAKKIRKKIDAAIDGTSRLKALAELFGRFKKLSERLAAYDGFGRPRMLVYLGSLELLFGADGKTKNQEIARLLKLVLGRKSVEWPVDFVIVGSEVQLGGPFSETLGQGRAFRQIPLAASGIPQSAKEQIRQRRKDGRMKIDDVSGVTAAAPSAAGPAPVAAASNSALDRSAGKPARDPSAVNYVHFARPVSAASHLLDNFPVLATAFYLNNPLDAPKPARPEAKERLDLAWKAFDKAVKDGRKASDDEMGRIWRDAKLPSAQMFDQARRLVWGAVERDCSKAILSHAELIPKEFDGTKDLAGVLRCRLKSGKDGARREWRQIRRFIGSNRFTITLLLAAAEQIVIQAYSAKEGARQAEQFIIGTVDQLRNVGADRREELVLKAVLDRYLRYHVIGDPDLDIEFHQLILRHLGVIGSPTSSAVLVRLPEFRDYFVRIGIELPTSRRRFLTRAMTVLAYRGLIFRIDPHPRLITLQEESKKEEDPYWPADQNFRYALHRTVQRYAISKLGVGNVDPVANNSFAPRLYASMPSIGTGLSAESHDFLRTLLVSLSQYPDIPNTDETQMPWLFTTQYPTIKVQALRAALSMARSTLSVATLSRVPTRMDQNAELYNLGLLENYKIRLRWIIRMAWELLESKEIKKRNYKPNGYFKHINPLYRDEIVWIYNELGVVAMSQGNLTEALGFLRQAAEFNEDIEGRKQFGPIFDYIDLNHAVVQFERGRLSSAVTRLTRIKRRARDDARLRWIAEGYLCVINHVQGEHEGLLERFNKVVEKLQELNDNRASAIFLSHRARFMAAGGHEDAGAKIGLARSLAETGGHEDIRYHIEISRLTVEYRIAKKKGENRGQIKTLQQLRDIEVYGRRMGIWSIQVDALKLRGEILLHEGETSTAGALLIRAIAIAKRNRMMLRLNSAHTTYAMLLRERGDSRGAERHAMLSLDLAKSIGYALQTSTAQRILSEINPPGY